MVYYNFQGDELQNEFDEKMTHKYGDKYRCVKNVYPDVYKLPEEEIQPMTHIIRYQGDTMDEAEDLLRKHIKKNEPMWQQNYFGGTSNKMSDFADAEAEMQNPYDKLREEGLKANKVFDDYYNSFLRDRNEMLYQERPFWAPKMNSNSNKREEENEYQKRMDSDRNRTLDYDEYLELMKRGYIDDMKMKKPWYRR